MKSSKLGEITKPGGNVLVDDDYHNLLQGENPPLVLDPTRIQPASCDLSVVGPIYAVSGAPSVVSGAYVEKDIITPSNKEHNTYSLEGGKTAWLAPGQCYIAQLNATFNLPAGYSGYANPKSSVGRDNFSCAVLADETIGYDHIPAGYKGKLYVVMSPQSFPIGLSEGENLVQIRLYEGQKEPITRPWLSLLQQQYGLIKGEKEPTIVEDGFMLHLDLRGAQVAFPTGKPIDLSLRYELDPGDYFFQKPLDNGLELYLEPGQFFLAFGMEEVWVPNFLCAELGRQEYSLGRFTAHEAGYIDPGFRGRMVYEVSNRGSFPIRFRQGQRLAVLRYELLSKRPLHSYGETEAAEKSNYQGQTSLFSKRFKR